MLSKNFQIFIMLLFPTFPYLLTYNPHPQTLAFNFDEYYIITPPSLFAFSLSSNKDCYSILKYNSQSHIRTIYTPLGFHYANENKKFIIQYYYQYFSTTSRDGCF